MEKYDKVKENRSYAIGLDYAIEALRLLGIQRAGHWWDSHQLYSHGSGPGANGSGLELYFGYRYWFEIPIDDDSAKTQKAVVETNIKRVTIETAVGKISLYDLKDIFVLMDPPNLDPLRINSKITFAAFLPDPKEGNPHGIRMIRSVGPEVLMCEAGSPYLNESDPHVITNQRVNDLEKAASLMFWRADCTGTRGGGPTEEAGWWFRLHILKSDIPYEHVDLGLNRESTQWIMHSDGDSEDGSIKRFLKNMRVIAIKEPMPRIRDSRDRHVFHAVSRIEEGDYIRLTGYMDKQKDVHIFFCVPKDVKEVELEKGNLENTWVLWDIPNPIGWVANCEPPRNVIPVPLPEKAVTK